MEGRSVSLLAEFGRHRMHKLWRALVEKEAQPSDFLELQQK